MVNYRTAMLVAVGVLVYANGYAQTHAHKMLQELKVEFHNEFNGAVYDVYTGQSQYWIDTQNELKKKANRAKAAYERGDYEYASALFGQIRHPTIMVRLENNAGLAALWQRRIALAELDEQYGKTDQGDEKDRGELDELEKQFAAKDVAPSSDLDKYFAGLSEVDRAYHTRLLTNGKAAFDTDNYDGAIDLFQQSVDLGHPTAHELVSMARQAKAGELDELEKQFAAKDVAPSNDLDKYFAGLSEVDRAYHTRLLTNGKAAFDTDNYDGAIDLFQQSVDLGHPTAHELVSMARQAKADEIARQKAIAAEKERQRQIALQQEREREQKITAEEQRERSVAAEKERQRQVALQQERERQRRIAEQRREDADDTKKSGWGLGKTLLAGVGLYAASKGATAEELQPITDALIGNLGGGGSSGGSGGGYSGGSGGGYSGGSGGGSSNDACIKAAEKAVKQIPQDGSGMCAVFLASRKAAREVKAMGVCPSEALDNQIEWANEGIREVGGC